MAFSAQSLIDKFEPKQDTFRIPTSDDPEEDMICRAISDVRDMTQVNMRAAELMKAWEKKTVHKSWLPYGPISKDVATIVAELTMLVVEPKFTEIQALKLCKNAGLFAAYVHTAIGYRMNSYLPMIEINAVENEKNGLSPTASTECTSQSDTNTSESTPTTSMNETGSEHANT